MSDWYILHDDHSTSKAETEEEEALAYACLEGDKKIVKQENVANKWVSTVFIGLDHNFGSAACDYMFGSERPLIFETMVFENGSSGDYWRYSTWQEAEEGHKRVCSELQSGLSREELEAAKAIIEPLIRGSKAC